MDSAAKLSPVGEHEKTRAAVAAARERLVRLLRDVRDPDAASGVPVWSVGDVGSHLAAVYLAYCSAATGDGSMDWDGILPPGDGTLEERITAVNAASIRLFADADRDRLGDFITERGETFLRETAGLAPDTPVAVPWFGKDATFTLATLTGLLLSETLLHGLDIARGARLPWPIAQEEARLAIGQTMPTLMPLTLDATRARGISLAFDLSIKGGPRLAVDVADRTMTVTRDAPPRRYDCRITATPVAFLLVSYGRTPPWKAIARGQMRAGGRKPWLAARFGQLISAP
ncbi:maleylpyruvate isomerase N-terminal domain-containing protein [Streptomyces bambusae]|uniref:maleylpyruvate isomerase N-terminal domain-containing protein n=1 Tax=Streptomyces bambusae TaxID=1550616 RepID=UPI001CFCEDAB|nr:maleylpyruvate isomerase N-terminal domain-containing protein [Streptomyces bambusae]MCB5168861.1 maleylpyruvate isomerase N-terminal domain-containing protein [Streptomyces bambusae]